MIFLDEYVVTYTVNPHEFYIATKNMSFIARLSRAAEQHSETMIHHKGRGNLLLIYTQLKKETLCL